MQSTLEHPRPFQGSRRPPLRAINATIENRSPNSLAMKPGSQKQRRRSPGSRPDGPGLTKEAERLIAQLKQVHRSVCDNSSDPSDDGVFDELETEALAIRESFKNAEFRQISQEELEELELRRLEEVKREGRETANRVGFHAVRDARTQ